MIGLVLSERDFDYELQALINSFFPGQNCRVFIGEDGLPELALSVNVFLGSDRITAGACAGACSVFRCTDADSEKDWHKHLDKTSHPYRALYKNRLKKMVFELLRDFPEDGLPAGIQRVIPQWGTMTGVRPTKIPMNELLQGKSGAQVRKDLEEYYCCQPDQADLCLKIAEKEASLLRGTKYCEEYSLYIGIPFCPSTCLYCSFPSYAYERFGHLSEAYVDALLKELGAVAGECSGHAMTTAYMGGGTPTALSAVQLERIMTFLEEHFPVWQCREWTVEAGRPDSITGEKLRVLKRHGVSRISINPQTMQDKTLRTIGRNHDVEDVVHAFMLARELGFDNINMDLIIGLPGENLADFEDTLEKVGKLNPDSITVHSLVIKRASKLRELLEQAGGYWEQEKQRRQQMDLMFQRSLSFSEEQGYAPYYMYRQKNSGSHSGISGQENIGFAKPGKESLYNVLMMEEMQTIAAAGAGASTKYYDASAKIVSRRENVKSITDYISRIDEMIERKRGRFWEKR